MPRVLKVGALALAGAIIATVALGALYDVKPYVVPTNSMEPAIGNGDRILAISGSVERGDIVTVRPNGERTAVFVTTKTISSRTFVKRLIGLPGELVGARGGRVFVCAATVADAQNGHASGCRFLREPYAIGRTLPFTARIPSDRYLLLGDNRENSEDSRSWGPVLRSQIERRVVFRYWPLSRIGIP